MHDLFQVLQNHHVEIDVPRDMLALNRKRCVMLTQHKTIDNFDARRLAQPAEVLAQARQKKEDEKAAKKAAAVREKREKQVAADKEKEEKRVAADIAKAAKQETKDQATRAREEERAEPRPFRKRCVGATCCMCAITYEESVDSGPMVQCAEETKCKSGGWFHFVCCGFPEDCSPRKDSDGKELEWRCMK